MHHDQPGVSRQSRDLGGAAHVLRTVGLAESQVAVDAPAQLIAVEQRAVAPLRLQTYVQQFGDGALAAPDSPVSNTTPGRWPFCSARALGVPGDGGTLLGGREDVVMACAFEDLNDRR